MELTLLKAKLHAARITHTKPTYEGSCAIDKRLLTHAGILEYEQLDIYNISNGERFTTYALAAEAHSGVISLLGAAAHKASVHDQVIICAYVRLDAAAARLHKPTLLYLDDDNKITRSANKITLQASKIA